MDRITVSTMKSQLEFLEKEGMGDKFISVNEYYISDVFNAEDKTGVWNDVTYNGIHYSEVPVTEQQQHFINKEIEEYTKNLTLEEKTFLKSIKGTTQDEIRLEQIEKYKDYLKGMKIEGRINEEEELKYLATIRY